MLKKSTFREIKTSLARYLAIFSIVALGVGFFAGLKDCKTSMVQTAAEYLDETNMYDYQIASSYGIDDASVDTAKSWIGVEDAEGTIQIDVMAKTGDGDSSPLKAISMPERINTLRVVEGRLPEKEDECIVDDYSITDEGFHIGDKIVLTDENDKDKLDEFRSREFTIVGTVNTPIYLDYQRGSTDIGNGSLDTFFFISRDAFDVDYYTSLYLTLEGTGEAFSEETDAKIEETEDSIEELAEEITADRRETAMKDAQEELDEKKKEYEDNLAEYERQKADAEKKLDSAEYKIKKGSGKIKGTRKELEAKLKELKANKAKLESGIQQARSQGKAAAEAEKSKLKEALDAGAITEEEYNAGCAKIDKETDAAVNAKVAELQGNLDQVNKGIAEIEAGLKQLDKEENKLEKNKKKLKKEEKKADSEFKDAKKKLDDAKDKLDDAQKKIDEMETGNSYAFSRKDNAGYSSFDSNSSIVSNIAKIFPVFFFLIAALVCMTTMTRMVDEQRTQIGVLKALGYSNAQVAAKYLFYSGSAAFMGAVLGFFVGCKIFPTVIWRAYTMMYNFTYDVDYVIDPVLGAVSIGAAMLCALGSTWAAIAQDFKVAPSELIRPKTPPAGRRILLERIGPVWRKISFLYKVSIRNIFRDRKRFLMMVIGVSGCTALLIAGLGIKTTIARVADYQYEEISLYDYTVIFSKNMNADRQQDFNEYMEDEGISADDIRYVRQAEVSVTIDKDNRADVTCITADPDDFSRFIDLHSGDEKIPYPGEGEVVIARKLSHDYGVQAGDEITLREGYKEMKVKVAAVCDNYVHDNIFISMDTYEKGFGVKPDIKTALVLMPDDADEDTVRATATHAAGYDDTAAVSVNIDVRDSVSKMMESLNSIVYVVLLSAALLAFIVLYNLTNINITERIREIATIKVLGFNQHEVSRYVFRENVFMTAIAALVGIPLGKWLLGFVIDNIVVKMIFFEPRLSRTDYIIAVVLTFVFAGVVDLAMRRRLANVSMTESLKSVE